MGPSCTEVKQKRKQKQNNNDNKTNKQNINNNKTKRKRNLFTHRATKSSLGNRCKGVRAFQVEFELEVLVFVEGGKPEDPEKTLGARMRTNNKFNPHMASTSGIEPRSALTTVSSLYPSRLPAFLSMVTL